MYGGTDREVFSPANRMPLGRRSHQGRLMNSLAMWKTRRQPKSRSASLHVAPTSGFETPTKRRRLTLLIFTILTLSLPMTSSLATSDKSVKTAPPAGRSSTCADAQILPPHTPAAQRESMRAKPLVGVVALSILSSRDPSPDFDRSRRLLENARWMNQLLDDHQFPATWFISDAEIHSVRARVASSKVPHEIGLLLDAGHSSARAAFGRELHRQLMTVGACGAEVSSVAKFGGPLQQLDLLVKRGISALCSIECDERSQRMMQWHKVEALRFGIWSLPATLEIGAGGWWSQAVARSQSRRQANDVANRAGFCHLTIELEQVGGRSARRTLKSAIAVASALREQGRLETRTLSGVVNLLTARCNPPGALDPPSRVIWDYRYPATSLRGTSASSDRPARAHR